MTLLLTFILHCC